MMLEILFDTYCKVNRVWNLKQDSLLLRTKSIFYKGNEQNSYPLQGIILNLQYTIKIMTCIEKEKIRHVLSRQRIQHGDGKTIKTLEHESKDSDTSIHINTLKKTRKISV